MPLYTQRVIVVFLSYIRHPFTANIATIFEKPNQVVGWTLSESCLLRLHFFLCFSNFSGLNCNNLIIFLLTKNELLHTLKWSQFFHSIMICKEFDLQLLVSCITSFQCCPRSSQLIRSVVEFFSECLDLRVLFFSLQQKTNFLTIESSVQI